MLLRALSDSTYRPDLAQLAQGNGCILADFMGLGKTLQSIALMTAFMNVSIMQGRHFFFDYVDMHGVSS